LARAILRPFSQLLLIRNDVPAGGLRRRRAGRSDSASGIRRIGWLLYRSSNARHPFGSEAAEIAPDFPFDIRPAFATAGLIRMSHVFDHVTVHLKS
jgi:hypothetical protein